MTESAKSIVALLSDAAEAIGTVEKKERNTQGSGYNFRGIDTVVNAVSPEFRSRGIIVTPCVTERFYEQLEVGKNRSLMGHVLLRTTFRFHGPSGDHLDATVESEAMDSGDKATAKAMSVGLRTALIEVLMLPTDELDPDESTYERSGREEAATEDGTQKASAQTIEAMRALRTDLKVTDDKYAEQIAMVAEKHGYVAGSDVDLQERTAIALTRIYAERLQTQSKKDAAEKAEGEAK